MMRVNVHATIQTVQAILPTLRGKGWGRIVNVTSLVIVGIALRSGYAAAKAAVNSLTRTWAIELAETGITVNAVAPGPTATDMIVRFAGDMERAQSFGETMPARRLGRPDEVAAAIVFAAIGNSHFMTGHSIFVDGGFTA